MSASFAQPRTFKSRRQSYVPDYDIGELFTSDQLELKLLLAQHRILKGFDRATYQSRGKIRGTDNFILGVGGRQKDLVGYIIDKVVDGMHSGIVTASELPLWVGNTESTLRVVTRNAERQLVALKLDALVPLGIWFEIGTGTWNVAPTVMDDYRLNRATAAAAANAETQRRRERLHGGRLRIVH